MSIETEFESTITNVKNAYQGLDNLGATIPENKTIENIKSCLDEIYAKFPKTDYAEGSNITLSNTLKGKLDFEDGIVGYGDTYQYSTQGINLFYINIADDNRTWNGVTIKSTKTGFSATGQASASGGYILINRYVTLPAGTYRLRLKKPTTLTKVGLAKTDYSEIVSIEKNSSLSSSFTLAEETNVCLRIVITNGETYNEENELMIYSGTAEKDFEPYTNGASPNPSYPQDIEVVRGKNIFNDELEQGYVDTNGINVSGTKRIRQKDYTKVKPNTTYVISCKNNTNKTLNTGISYYTTNDFVTYRISGTSWSGLPYSFTTPDNCNYIRAIFKFTDESTILPTDISELQLEKGSTATSYLPYNTLEVVERGKNLLPNNWTSGSISSSTGQVVPYGSRIYTTDKIKVKPNTTYIVNNNNSSNYNINNIIDQYDNNETYIGRAGTYLNGYTFTTSANAEYINITLNNTSDQMTYAIYQEYLGNGTLKPILAEGTNDTYELYQTPQTYQLSLGEYEFAKTGNYVDTIEYDVDEDKVYKNKAINKFNGGELNWTHYDISINGVASHLFRTAYDTGVKKATNGLSNYYTCLTQSTRVNPCFYINNDNPYIDVVDNNHNDGTEYKTYCNSNNIVFYAPLETPTKTEITGTLKDQIKALYNSHSFTGTTIIEIDGQLPLIIKVRALKGE